MEDYKKKYEDALERAREMCAMPTDKATMEYVFPELKESEDEKIRKSLLNEFTHLLSKGCNKFAGLENEDIITWLEKQGNPTDKVEPKFKVGDWVVQGNRVYKVVEICESWYEVIDGEDNHFSISFDNEHMCRLWEISKDAKDGDVLYSPCCKLLWIYKDGNSCYIGNNLNYNENCVVVNSPICIPTDVVPATKEQRDILFQKMHKAGYEWDAEKKELKLLISNGGDFEPELSHQEATEKSEQDKPTNWTEEDEKVRKQLLDFVHRNALASYSDRDKWVAWLENNAFIEKACDAYCKVCKMPNCRRNECKFISEFINYMKGE